LECFTIQDVLVVSDAIESASSVRLKGKRKRLVAVLTRLAMPWDGLSELPAWYDAAAIDYEHEHRCAEEE
jgi:hypothetical protein